MSDVIEVSLSGGALQRGDESHGITVGTGSKERFAVFAEFQVMCTGMRVGEIEYHAGRLEIQIGVIPFSFHSW